MAGELLPLIEKGLLKPEEIVTHYMPFEEAARGYEIFEKREEECRKVIPGAGSDVGTSGAETGDGSSQPDARRRCLKQAEMKGLTERGCAGILCVNALTLMQMI